MTRRELLAAGLVTAIPLRSAQAAGPDADAILLSVTAETPAGGPLVQEMVILNVRAIFRTQPNEVTLEPPEFVDARWQVLGEDQWSHVSLGGPDRVQMQRRIAWFAQRSGRLSVGAFVLRASVLTAEGARVPVQRRTNPLQLAVQPAPADAGTWWLPARSLRILETWSAPPDRLPIGQVARRTLVIEAEGVEAPQLPSLPPLHPPGVIAFATPVVTRTTLMPSGPLVRAIYAWDIKPVSAQPALLPEIRLPWFDTQTRQMREAIVPAQPVSLAGSVARPPLRDQRGGGAVSIGPREVAAGAGAFLLGSAVLHSPLAGIRAAWSRRLLTARIRRAGRCGDWQGVRILLAQAPPCPGIVEAKAALDRHLYAEPPSADAKMLSNAFIASTVFMPRSHEPKA